MQMQTPHIAAQAPAAATATSTATDSALAGLAATGDQTAFECIMRRHNRMLFRTARSILRNDAEAEDALQEAYLRAWRMLSTFRGESKLATWLTRIVINEALGRKRRLVLPVVPLETAMESPDLQAQEAMADDPDRQPERTAMRSEMRLLMQAHIDRLPDAFRTVFMLRAVEESSVEEVAAALDIPEATVRTRFFRARGLLREGLSLDVDLAASDAFAFLGARCDRIVAGVLGRL